jgi:hypothetical protein
MRLNSIFRSRRSAEKPKLDSKQARALRENLRALLLSKEHLAAKKEPTARPV